MIKCPNCGQELPDQTKFCRFCGSGIAQAPVQAPAYAEQTNYYAEQSDNYYAEPYATADANNAAAAQKSPVDSIKEIFNKIPKKFLIAGVAVILVLAIIIGIVSIAGGGKDDFVLYYKDGELYFSDFSGDPIQVTDDLEDRSASPKITEDGDTIFYIDEDGKLFYRSLKNEKKDPVKLANDVSGFYINDSGKKVIYRSEGNLYLHDLKQSEKIAKDVVNYIISLDLKKIYFTNDEGDLYYLKVGKDAEKIASDVAEMSANENLKYLYYAKSSESEEDEDSEDEDYDDYSDSVDLYMYKEGGESVKVDSDASPVGMVYKSGAIYYAKESDDEDDYSVSLYYYDGKASVVVAENYSTYYDYSSDKPIIVYSELDYSDEDAEYTYAIAKEDKVIAINAEDIANIKLAEDNKTIYYAVLDKAEEDSEEEEEDYSSESNATYTLYKTSISGSSLKEAKTVDTEVESSSFTLMGSSKVAYEKDDNTLFINGEKIVDDVSNYYYYADTKTLYVESDVSEKDGTYTLSTTKGKKLDKVADDVADWNITEAGKIYYITDVNDNGEGTLYLAKGKNPKQLDEDVTDFEYNGRSDGGYGEVGYYTYSW